MKHLNRLAIRSTILAAALACACVNTAQTRQSSSIVDYLYPPSTEGRFTTHEPVAELTLSLPARVGIAFVPTGEERGAFYDDTNAALNRFRQNGPDLDETLRRGLLESVAEAFEGRPEIASIEVLPTHQLRAGGGFDEVDRLGAMYGLDLLALVSYDQIQFGRETANAWTYITLLGALAVEADETETRTLLDTTVFDIQSRTLLVTAAGMSSDRELSTPIETPKAVRVAAEAGFASATEDLIAHLDEGLERMAENVKAGTARGPGSPAVKVEVRPGNHGLGTGAFSWFYLLILAGLGLAYRRQA